MRAVCAAALVVAAAAAAVATAPSMRAADAILMLAALVSLFAACDASMRAADRLENAYKTEEEEEEDDVIKEAPLTLVKEGAVDEQGTWAPGKGADFAVRSSTYLDNGVIDSVVTAALYPTHWLISAQATSCPRRSSQRWTCTSSTGAHASMGSCSRTRRRTTTRRRAPVLLT